MQDSLVAYDQDMQTKLMSKQEELLKPILDRVNEVIKEISKTDGYTLVFDLSSGAILFADENSDITKKVMEKLGIAQ